MKHPVRRALLVVAATHLALTAVRPAHAQPPAPTRTAPKPETAVTTRAIGTFDVKLTPQAAEDQGGGAAVGRLTLDKRFHGDLEATSKGQMLAARTGVQGSAGYVAIELVSGTLHGRTGTFVLQHSGTMDRGAPQLTVTVVPDSGTGELVGLAGSMVIDVADGKHSYVFEYTLTGALP